MSSWLNRSNPKPKQNTVTQISQVLPINVHKFDVILPSINIFEIDSYDDTIHRFNNFTNNNTDALITFIIPSINRDTLPFTIKSLLSQKYNKWKAIIIFDGCQPTSTELLNLLKDDRILYFSIKKLGLVKDIIHGAAGFVRNIGMNLVTTPWIGFVDDDDVILPNYINALTEELKINPTAELISFRMMDNDEILPPDTIYEIKSGRIGISFCFKTDLFKEGFKFVQSEQEDFDFIDRIKNANKKIILSPFITYIVRNSLIKTATRKRIVIN
jgi:glycosyltransferase involved in cell wall biosynthesis